MNRTDLLQRHRDLVAYLRGPRDQWQRQAALTELAFLLRALHACREVRS